MLKMAFRDSGFQNFLRGAACPQTPLEARAFGARFCEHHLKILFFGPLSDKWIKEKKTSNLTVYRKKSYNLINY